MATDTAAQTEQTPPATASFFVEYGATRVPLDDRGNWVSFKNSLTFKEALTLLFTADTTGQGATPEARADTAIAELVMYITDWRLTNAAGKSVPFSPDAVADLTPAAARLIREALAGHLRTFEEPPAAAPNQTPEGQEGNAPPVAGGAP